MLVLDDLRSSRAVVANGWLDEGLTLFRSARLPVFERLCVVPQIHDCDTLDASTEGAALQPVKNRKKKSAARKAKSFSKKKERVRLCRLGQAEKQMLSDVLIDTHNVGIVVVQRQQIETVPPSRKKRSEARQAKSFSKNKARRKERQLKNKMRTE